MFEQEDSCSKPCLQKISCPAEWIVTLNSYVTCLQRKTTMAETLSLICKHTIFPLASDDCSSPELIAACVCFASSFEDGKEGHTLITESDSEQHPGLLRAVRTGWPPRRPPTKTRTQLAQCVLWLLDFTAMSSCAYARLLIYLCESEIKGACQDSQTHWMIHCLISRRFLQTGELFLDWASFLSQGQRICICPS